MLCDLVYQEKILIERQKSCANLSSHEPSSNADDSKLHEHQAHIFEGLHPYELLTTLFPELAEYETAQTEAVLTLRQTAIASNSTGDPSALFLLQPTMQTQAHKELTKLLAPYQSDRNTKKFFESIDQKNYSQALRRACTGANFKTSCDLIKLLLDFSRPLAFNPRKTNDAGKMAYDIAKEREHESICDLLTTRGAGPESTEPPPVSLFFQPPTPETEIKATPMAEITSSEGLTTNATTAGSVAKV